MRVSRQDAKHALKHDEFFEISKKAAADPDFGLKLQTVSSRHHSLWHEHTQSLTGWEFPN